MGDNRDKIIDFANLIKKSIEILLSFLAWVNNCMHETSLTIQFAPRELTGVCFQRANRCVISNRFVCV